MDSQKIATSENLFHSEQQLKMNQQQPTNLAPMILGLLLGGLITTVLVTQLVRLRPEQIVITFILGSILGLCVGFGYSQYTLLMARRRQEKRLLENEQAPPPRPPTQVVGRKCIECESPIIFEKEGSFCPNCFEPFCTRCKESVEPCVRCQ